MLLAILAAIQAPTTPRPTLLDDALYRIADVTGRVQRVHDCDGNGRDDLVMECGGEQGAFERIVLVSTAAGKLIRTLWHRAAMPDSFVDAEAKAAALGDALPASWDAGGDVDGDGVPDLVLGFPSERGRGRVEVVSGSTGKLLYTLTGANDLDRMGASVAFLGDLDGDGFADFACGVPEASKRWESDGRPVVLYKSSTTGHSTTYTVEFADRTSEDQLVWTQKQLKSRSSRAGHVSVRSGHDCHEIGRIDGASAGLGFGMLIACAGDIDRDGTLDLIAQCDNRSTEPIRVYSGKTRALIASIRTRFGAAKLAGDLDGDHVPDLILDAHEIGNGEDRMGAAHFVSGKTRQQIFELGYPDLWSSYGITVAVGDLDGDGFDDVGFGEPNYNLRGKTGGPLPVGEVPDLSKLTLDEALALASDPWNAFTWESGYAILYSSKSRKVIWGAWAPPGSRKGLGFAVVALPDVNGDGFADILVTDSDSAYVFAGPPRPKK